MAIALVQQDNNGAASVTDGASVAFDSNVGSGVLLVAICTLPSNTVTVNAISDSLGNTWARAVQGPGEDTTRVEIWYAHCATGGACTVTFDWTGTLNGQINMQEWSGFPDGVTFDTDERNSNTFDNTVANAGEITTAAAESLIVVGYRHTSAFSVSSRETNWTALTATSRGDFAYLISGPITTDGDVTFAAIESGTAAIAAFSATEGGGGDDPKPWLYRLHTQTIVAGLWLGGVASFSGAALSHLMGIGGASDDGATYRVQTDQAATVQIEYSTNSDLSSSTTSTGVSVVSDDDFTGGEAITGLNADTTYYYAIKVDGVRKHSAPFPSFKTFPTVGVDADVTIAFGSCQTSPTEASIFVSIAADTPDLFIHCGDFGYPDSTDLTNQRNNYKTQYANDFASAIVRAFPREHIWDDHDFGANNSTGDLANKANSLQAFKEFIPLGTLPNGTNGLWRLVQIGNVDIAIIDPRYNSEGTKVRFPTTAGATFTADTGSSGTSLVLASADSPSGSNDFYNGWYVEVEGVVRRITDYVGSTRTCTLSASVTGLDDASTYYLRKASRLDQDFIADDQVDWLIAAFTGSSARWKILVSPVVWNGTYTTQPLSSDSWGGWDVDQIERKYLLQELSGVTNLIVISGDRHVSGIDDGTNADWPEITASPLNNNNASLGGTWSEGTYDDGHAYGLIEIDGTAHTATLTIKDANGDTATGVTPLVVNAA